MHHVVYVVGDDDLDAALEPFQENNMGTVDEKYLEFIDETSVVQEEWRDYPLTLLATEGSDREYKTIEEFATRYFGWEVQDGRFGYIENPNAKWDWYELGGRWADRLKLCTGVKSSQAPLEMVDIDNIESAAAVLYQGQWIEPDVGNRWNYTEEEEAAWLDKIKAILRQASGADIISVVDCHI